MDRMRHQTIALSDFAPKITSSVQIVGVSRNLFDAMVLNKINAQTVKQKIPGVNDCGDRSDEIDCGPDRTLIRPDGALVTNTVCPPGSFTCSNGLCINQTRVCDGHSM
jgi:hypothetical protein